MLSRCPWFYSLPAVILPTKYKVICLCFALCFYYFKDLLFEPDLKEFHFFTFSLQLVLRRGILSWLQGWSYWFHHADTCYWRHGQILLNLRKQPISRYSTQFSDSISNLINYHLYHYLQKVIWLEINVEWLKTCLHKFYLSFFFFSS